MVVGIAIVQPNSLKLANERGVFSCALALYRRVEPSPLPDSWWIKTCCVVDVTTS
eukprot:COSAG02_NODE_52597_length_307_cov_0.259615_1_plen_54_part_10